ncbi:MAG: glycoside hydrolase family 25 protein [Candidatus Fimenecus sp.]
MKKENKIIKIKKQKKNKEKIEKENSGNSIFERIKNNKTARISIVVFISVSLISILFSGYFAFERKRNIKNIGTVPTTSGYKSSGIFGDNSDITKPDNSEMIFKINETMNNIAVASGDAIKDEDGNINKSKDFGTNSSRLSPSKSPKVSALNINSVEQSFFYNSSLTNKYYLDISSLSGLYQIGSTIYNFKDTHLPYQGFADFNDVKYKFNDKGAKASLVGIDVSNHNGKIDWNAVKASGVDCAVIRVGFRGYGNGDLKLDSKFNENIAAAKAAGIKVGVYFYSQAINVREALEEASVAVNYARVYSPELPIYIDTEFTTSKRDGRGDKLSASQRTQVVVAFCEAVKNAGFKPGIYASKTFFTDELLYDRISEYEFWVAHYTADTTDFRYPYKAWQYTSTSSVSGISGNVDLNIFLYDYALKSDFSNLGKELYILKSRASFKASIDTDTRISLYNDTPTDDLRRTIETNLGMIDNIELQTLLRAKIAVGVSEITMASQFTTKPSISVVSSTSSKQG